MIDSLVRLIKLAKWMGKNGRETIIGFLLLSNVLFLHQKHDSDTQKDKMYSDLLTCKQELEDEKTQHLKDVMSLNNSIQYQKDVQIHAKDSLIIMLKKKLEDVNALINKSNRIIKNNVGT